MSERNEFRRLRKSLKRFALEFICKSVCSNRSCRIQKKYPKKTGEEILDDLVDVLIDLASGRTEAPFIPTKRPFSIEVYTLIGRTYASAWSDAYKSGLIDEEPMGVFYTPAWIARRLVHLVLEQGQAIDAIVDPACGTGSLLLAWMQRKPETLLVGWDIDRRAIRLAKVILESYARDYHLSARIELVERDLFVEDSECRQFDAVLMNPPFGTRLTASAEAFARQSGLAGREADLFVLALHRALMLPGTGPVGAIVPDVLRMQPEYKSIRRVLSFEWTVRWVEKLPFGAFPEATVQPDLIVVERTPTGRDTVGIQTYGEPVRFLSLEDIRNDPEYRLTMEDSRSIRVWEQCCVDSVRLGEIARCHEGIHTGNIRSKLFTENPRHKNARPLLKGADITPFGYFFNKRYIRYNSRLINRSKGEYASLRDPYIFIGPKLLSRQTSNRLVVCLDWGNYVTDNSIHCIKLKPGVDLTLQWLAVVLNSDLATALYRSQSGEHQRPMPQIKLAILRKLPIRNPKVDEKEIFSLYEKAEIEAKSGGVTKNTVGMINEVVFDSYEIDENDRSWILDISSR